MEIHNANIQPSNVNPIKTNADGIINKIRSNPSTNASAETASKLWELSMILANASAVISKAGGESGIAAIKYGFNSADKSLIAGGLIAAGGASLGVAGGLQGVAGCKNATELAQAAKIREDQIAKINARTIQEPDITIKVEAVDEPVSPVSSTLDEVEEEVFYDAEETLSCKQDKSEEESVNTQDKLTAEEAVILIKEENAEHVIKKDLIKAKTDKMKGLAAPGQGIQIASQGVSDVKKSASKKDDTLQEMQNDNRNQLKNTADDVKRKGDKLTEFNPFEQSSSSLRG